ncbi:MAG TPA: hypothetical protein VHI13_12250 [Candidatus Kapabacteria bacterium]|nr:hypothetical protein [Candidatus Kapabacteria bacterium]
MQFWRRTALLAIGAVIGMGSFMLLAFKGSDTLTTHRLQIVNSKGVTVIDLQTSGDNGRIDLFNRFGQRMMWIDVLSDGTGMSLNLRGGAGINGNQVSLDSGVDGGSITINDSTHTK